MKAKPMIKTFIPIFILGWFLTSSFLSVAQCPTDLLYGVNVVQNPSFTNGYANWTYTADPARVTGYKAYGGGFSVPGDIYAGSSADYFNPGGFDDFPDHTGTADNMMLMVDGICQPDIKLWQQTVNVSAGKTYYFSVWIHTLKDFNVGDVLATLRFDVNNSNLGGITAPRLLSDGWIQFETVWSSPFSGPVVISIENTTITECNTKIDFAIDDLAFIEGCGYASLTPQPNLGIDRSLCGTGGSITLNSGITPASDINVTWYDGTGSAIVGLGAPYTKTITTPGTYYTCVTKTGSCTKLDTVVITNTFTPTTSPNANLCSTGGSAPLDAVYTGTGVTYQWKLNGTNLPAPSTNRTYTATAPGNYTVDVTVPGCGTVSSGTTVITSSATAAPTTSANGDLCRTNPVPLDAVLTGTGITYQWKLNGTNLPAPSTNRTYSAISPGNYTVDVKLPGCTTTTSGTTVVTSSSSVTPVDAVYCATSGAVGVTLGATGTNSANFKWYTAATGGSPVNTGASYNISIPMGTTATQTYYVEDPTVQTGTVGQTAEFTTGSLGDVYPDNAMTSNAQWGINFSPTQDFTLNSVKVPIRIVNADAVAMNISITLRVYTSAGVATAYTSTSTNTVTIPAANAAAYTLYQFNFSGFTIPLSAGPNLVLKIESKTTNYLPWRYNIGNRTSLTNPFPYSSTISPNPLTISSSFSSNSNVTNQYFGLYNWNISATSPCTRIPVRAINNCVTPVTWTSFYLVPQDDNSCKLVWSTASETNNAYFAIERSVDGINFETIATVSGGGNRDIASNYFYVDTEPVTGTSYYRITQHDYDGKFSSTEMKPYSSQGLIQVTTYPNPFQNNTTLLVSGPDGATYTYTLYSVNGQLVEQGSGTINQIQTVGETLAKGMYMLTVLTSTDIVTAKIVKQ